MKTIVIAVAVAGVATLAGGRTAQAQLLNASLDAGPSRVTYADSIEANAFSLSPSVQLQSPHVSAAGSGTFSMGQSSSSHSGSLSGSLSTTRARRVSAEAAGIAGGSMHSDGARTGQMLGLGRLHVARDQIGAWLGGGMGRTWDGDVWRGVVQGSIGAWLASAPGSAVLSLTPAAVDDTIRYTDALVTLHRAQGSLELSASFGARFGDPIPTLVTDRAWGNVSAVYWLRRGVGIVGAAGTYPIDFTQGFPGGRFMSLAVRFSAERSSPSSDAPGRAASFETAAEVQRFELQPAPGGQRFRVLAPGVRSVEIAGSFSNWTALPLRAEAGGWWSVVIPVTSGPHEMNVRIDGGPWRVPPGMTAVPDEFGGAYGLLVVP